MSDGLCGGAQLPLGVRDVLRCPQIERGARGSGNLCAVGVALDLTLAVAEIDRRIDQWRNAGLDVGLVTWRDQGDGWPPPFKTDRTRVKAADSIGIALRKGDQEGEVVLFDGGWCDFVYWTGEATDAPIQDAPGFPDEMTVEAFGAVLDRLAEHFR